MPKPTRPTLAQFERELRRILQTDIVIEVAELPCSARVTFGKPHRITVDPFEGGIKPAVIHELTHVARYEQLDRWGQLEEPVVEAIEAEMVRYIDASRVRRLWWRRRIERKLNESDGGR